MRLSSVLRAGGTVLAAYDGRATAGENWEERTGTAHGPLGALTASGGPIGSPHPPHGLRYLCVVPLADGRQRLYYEATRADGAHELRTEIV